MPDHPFRRRPIAAAHVFPWPSPPAPRRGALAAAVLLLALAGCATPTPDAGFDAVERLARPHLGAAADAARWARSEAERDAAAARVAELLAQPLSPEAAVQVALLNNPELQAAYQQLAIADAERVQAGRLPNPGWRFSRLRRGDELEFERSLSFDLARLLALPWSQQAEARRVAQVQAGVATQLLALAADTRKAWVQAVATVESQRYAAQVLQAAEAGAELARRMAQVGNFNRLQQAREQSFQAEAELGVARAGQQQLASRERLLRLLGLTAAQARALRLPDRLPALPAQLREAPQLEAQALAQRLDVQAARDAAEQAAVELGQGRVARWVNVFELGLQRNGASQAPTQQGWEIALELPLFDAGEARVARAEARHRQTLLRAAATAVQARSEVREAYGQYRTAWTIARHQRDELLPLRQRIADENLLRYNGMLIGVFELLADARAQVAGVNAAIEATRDYWLAEAELDFALVGRPGPASFAAPAASSSSVAAEAGGGH